MDKNQPEIQVKAQFDKVHEKQIRKNFDSFAKLCKQIDELEHISQDFIEEMKVVTCCLGIIILTHSEEYAEFRNEEQQNKGK